MYSIDVGTSQLDEKLKKNNRVISVENTDFRNIEIDKENKFRNDNIDTVVGDLSFISLKKIIDKIVEISPKNIILLIKPQFEVGQELARKYNGIIEDKKKHVEIIEEILRYYLEKLNDESYNSKNDELYILKGLTYSPILINNLKEKKNIEYLMYICKTRDKDKYKDKEKYKEKEKEKNKNKNEDKCFKKEEEKLLGNIEKIVNNAFSEKHDILLKKE